MKYKVLLLLTCLLASCSNQTSSTAPAMDSSMPGMDMSAAADDTDATTVPADEQAAAGPLVSSPAPADDTASLQSLAVTRVAGAVPTLVGSYRVNRKIGTDEQPEYGGTVYRPRQVTNGVAIETTTYNSNGKPSTLINAGPYAGWDLLLPRNNRTTSLDTRPDWFVVRLNRPATVLVGVRSANVPAWLSGWTHGTDLQAQTNGKTETIRTFQKTFAAGVTNLGGVAAKPGGENPYIVMLAEQNGQPSAAPVVPAGNEVPVANSTCPAWVHDLYMTAGPDGVQYRTWHPQIDPVYWCYFNHEHGSDPSVAGSVYSPAFMYTAGKDGMSEPHAGFKVSVVKAPAGGYWVLTHHFGTGGIGRACVSMHTVDMAYVQNNVLKVNLHFMGNFGRGMVTQLKNAYQITGCAAPATAVTPSFGARMINLNPNKGYEPWRMDSSMLKLGVTMKDLTFDTGDPITACATVECTALVKREGNTGSDHRVVTNSDIIVSGTGQTQGTFYTSADGTRFLKATDAGAVQQYIAPGFVLKSGVDKVTCFTLDAWRGEMGCGGKLLAPGKSLENSIGAAN
ncbi:hypothetical protein [Deinococcus aquiradiocola]|uniref:Uncharacterized protein n=1 Tax=Deinococcus aquiradiocola TaxID=393059 RepID=A0A917UQK6_9DEIO|nr:hypothetical protein [Deinococcus aquiradiocola]GGJ75830.1 hypothetical protein GCM10008939_20090 [Deinococcus aquiradiocola]